MKKRILSVLLAAIMVAAVFVMPASVSAAAVSNNYSYKFAETDARNFVAGQVFDVAAKGEAQTAPTIDGEIGEGEYAVSGAIALNSCVGGAAPLSALPVNFNVKDGYLYVAFVYFGETSQKDIQFDIGVSQDERSDGAWSRKQVTWKADNTTGDHAYLIKVPGTADWAGGSKAMDSDEFLVEYKWQDGIYEAKFDLERYYRLFGISCRGVGIYDTPCVTVAIWYNVSNTIPDGESTVKDPSAPGQTHYAFKVDSCKVNSAVNTGWLPATVIIPAESLALIRSTKGVVGALGTDWRNAVAGQFVGVDKYAAVNPSVDGTIGASEYQTSATYNSTYTTDGKITYNYSVGEDGLIYVGIQYKEATHSGLIIHTGLVPDSGLAMKNRAGFQMTTNGSLAAQSMWYLDPISAGWCKQTFGTSANTTGKNDEQLARADVASASSHKDGTTVYEYTLSIPMLIAGLEDHDWGADSANVLMTFAFPGGEQVKVDGFTNTLGESLNVDCGTSYSPGYFSPMFGLPEDAIERFKVSNSDDLEAFGQHHLDPVKNTVTLDGVISNGEYGASYEYTNANFEKKGIVGTNYFSGDDDWFYIGAKVYDPVYKPGTTYYQYDISVLSEDKVDCAESVRRMNGSIKVNEDGTVAVGTPGMIWRTQTCTAGGGAEEVAAKARMAEIALADFVKGNAIYDADTKTVTYEIAIKKSAIIKTFDLDASKPLEKIGYFNYYATDGVAEFNYLLDNAKVYAVLQGLTRADHNGALAYGTVMPAGAIITLKDDFATKSTASVRMSTENSGLRFKTVYSDAYLAEMKAYAESKGVDLEVGTLIAPYDYVLDVYAFTHSALEGKFGAGKGYVEVMATLDAPISKGAGTTTYAGSIVKIKTENLDREFAGVGFVKVGDEYFYSDVFTVKSVSRVASSAVADTATAQGNGYNYEVSAGVWSPYTAGQRDVLNALIAK